VVLDMRPEKFNGNSEGQYLIRNIRIKATCGMIKVEKYWKGGNSHNTLFGSGRASSTYLISR
jgi:hypothetical protein